MAVSRFFFAGSQKGRFGLLTVHLESPTQTERLTLVVQSSQLPS